MDLALFAHFCDRVLKILFTSWLRYLHASEDGLFSRIILNSTR